MVAFRAGGDVPRFGLRLDIGQGPRSAYECRRAAANCRSERGGAPRLHRQRPIVRRRAAERAVRRRPPDTWIIAARSPHGPLKSSSNDADRRRLRDPHQLFDPAGGFLQRIQLAQRHFERGTKLWTMQGKARAESPLRIGYRNGNRHHAVDKLLIVRRISPGADSRHFGLQLFCADNRPRRVRGQFDVPHEAVEYDGCRSRIGISNVS